MRGEEEGVVGSSSPGDAEKVHYKIGDLGHVASIYGGEVSPEEGDCRYMAPEFLEMEVSLVVFINLQPLWRNHIESIWNKNLKPTSGKNTHFPNFIKNDKSLE